LRLPNTRELLVRVHTLAGFQKFWGQTQNLEPRLKTAYSFLYPESGTGYKPDAVDFFSLLKAYTQIGKGLPGGLADSDALLTDLKFAIANALVSDLRDADQALANPHGELDRILTPGNVVITLNWDTMLERYAYLHDIPIRLLGEPDPGEVLLLKLHGSIDWTLATDAKKPVSQADYASLRERIKRTHPADKESHDSTVYRDDVTGQSGRTRPHPDGLGFCVLRPKFSKGDSPRRILHAPRRRGSPRASASRHRARIWQGEGARAEPGPGCA
jgi:hypothetical protein